MALSLLGVFGQIGLVSAEPVTLQDTEQAMVDPTGPVPSILETSELLADDLTVQNKAAHTVSPASGRVAPVERTTTSSIQSKPATATSSAPLPNGKPDPSLGAEIRSSVKESIRPLHDQLVESGAVDAWKALKTDLGLAKNEWNEEGANAGHPKMSGPADGPNAARWQEPESRPKTAAQAQMDRELATHMMEKLIDEVTPWAISLLGIYLLGYLIKVGINQLQQKSIRRQEHKARRILRQSSRKADTKPDV